MIKTQLKFEGKIHYSSKLVAFTRNHTSFKSNLTLKVKVKVTSFQTHPRYLDDNEQFECQGKFESQFDLECQGQGHKF